jgi:methionyl-tRNA formyltransferase
MRIVFFGSGAFGLPTLEHLAKRHEVVGIVTQSDKPAGRGGKVAPTAVGAWAAEHLAGVPLLKPAKVNEAGVVARVRAIPADAWIVIAFGQKLSRALLEGRLAVNLHASLLPRWRGASPISAAILAGDTETGNTVITLSDRMDAGEIVGVMKREIRPLMTAGELHDELSRDGPMLIESVLGQMQAGTLRARAQDEGLVTIATKLSRADDHVDFLEKADFVRRQVHALTPWPGATVAVLPPGKRVGNDEESAAGPGPLQIKVLRVQPETGVHEKEPGTVLDAARGIVACGQGTRLRILEVQPPGRTPMKWEEFTRGAGRKIEAGATLVPARELA